jgi:hypothetical protein
MSAFRGAAALLTTLTISAPAIAAEDCALRIITEVDIIADGQSGAWAIPVFFGETEKYFQINTASPFSSINESVVAELGIETFNSSTPMIDLTTGERFNPALARPDQFRIGRLGAENFAFQVDRGEGPDGTLGSSVLRNYDVELDFVNRKFFLVDQDHCPGQILHWETPALSSVPMRVSDDNGHAFIDIKVNGVNMEAQISLAGGQTSMNLDVAERRLDFDPDAEGVQELGELQAGNRSEMMYATTFNAIEIGAFTLPSAEFVLMPDLLRGRFSNQPTVGTMIYDREEPTRLVDVTLGMSVLRHFHIYMAYGENMFYLSPAAPIAAP